MLIIMFTPTPSLDHTSVNTVYLYHTHSQRKMKFQITFNYNCNGQSESLRCRGMELLEGSRDDMKKALETMKAAGFDFIPYGYAYGEVAAPLPCEKLPFSACDLAEFDFYGKISSAHEEDLRVHTVTLEFESSTEEARRFASLFKDQHYWTKTLEGERRAKYLHLLPIKEKMLHPPDNMPPTMKYIRTYHTGLVYNYLRKHPYVRGTVHDTYDELDKPDYPYC